MNIAVIFGICLLALTVGVVWLGRIASAKCTRHRTEVLRAVASEFGGTVVLGPRRDTGVQNFVKTKTHGMSLVVGEVISLTRTTVSEHSPTRSRRLFAEIDMGTPVAEYLGPLRPESDEIVRDAMRWEDHEVIVRKVTFDGVTIEGQDLDQDLWRRIDEEDELRRALAAFVRIPGAVGGSRLEIIRGFNCTSAQAVEMIRLALELAGLLRARATSR